MNSKPRNPGRVASMERMIMVLLKHFTPEELKLVIDEIAKNEGRMPELNIPMAKLSGKPK